MAAAGGFALIGFPLDDMWHRLFGQDVTLWGPTHLMLIGGASISLIGQAILLAEGTRSRPGGRERGVPLRRASLAGGFLIGLSTFQAEFDFGVPQFDFLFQPMLIALAAGIGLVSARLWGGRGTALGAVVFFIVMRGFVSLMVHGVWGEALPHFPLYLVEALLVEATAAALLARRGPLVFGVGRRPADRHRRHRRRVGLVARLDAAPVADGAAARGRRRERAGRPRRRARGHVHRHRAAASSRSRSRAARASSSRSRGWSSAGWSRSASPPRRSTA